MKSILFGEKETSMKSFYLHTFLLLLHERVSDNIVHINFVFLDNKLMLLHES